MQKVVEYFKTGEYILRVNKYLLTFKRNITEEFLELFTRQATYKLIKYICFENLLWELKISTPSVNDTLSVQN